MQDTYTWFRAFADSWVLLAMILFYLGAIVLAFLPRSRAGHDEAASIPFRHDPDVPAAPSVKAEKCGKDCAACACGSAALALTFAKEDAA